MNGIESHYKQEGDAFLIEIKLRDIMQLFNSLDPSPFHEKDLDDDAEHYIVGTVREFPLKTPLKLVIHIPPAAVAARPQGFIQQAIHHYFEYKAQVTERELKHILWQGRVSLIIGLLFLFACISARQLVAGLGQGTFYEILQEGLLISGWVAMWRPIQTFLYDWWPIRVMGEVYKKLATLDIDIRTTLE